MSQTPRYWFPAKRYGWGWGPPATWQGWLVLTAFIAAQAALCVHLLPAQPVRLLVATALLTGVLVGICLVKGEPPAWRWGESDR